MLYPWQLEGSLQWLMKRNEAKHFGGLTTSRRVAPWPSTSWHSAEWHSAEWRQENDTQHNKNATVTVSAIYAEFHNLDQLWRLPLCWVSLCWVSLCWMSWRLTNNWELFSFVLITHYITDLTRKSDWTGRLSTVHLLVLSSFDQLFIMKILFTFWLIRHHNEVFNCTDVSSSVNFPWF